MGTVNRAIVVGFVGQDPEIKQNGDRKMAIFSLATTERWRDKQSGEKKEHTDWHRVVVFNDAIAKVVEQYVKKGACVFIEGQMKTRKWTDKDGIDRYTTEVVLGPFNSSMKMLDKSPSTRPPDAQPGDYGYNERSPQRPMERKAERGELDDDDTIPF